MTSRARLLLPKPPNRKGTWDVLRDDLRRSNIHLTILGLTPEGRPHVKLVGTRDSLRRWLDGCGHWNVVVEEGK